jgi:putative intracellular protease/amidase
VADVRPANVWEDFVVKDGRIVSGTNPQSAKSAAQMAVAAFDNL